MVRIPDFFATPLKKIDALVVPTVSIYEVFKSVFRQRGESAGFQAVAVMKQGTVTILRLSTFHRNEIDFS
ncbi:MAG: type II toxin-antitoxin system VapC family toxin [Planctomycetes bacterium]|nr:type II toxin-antitoxin system VapC family toxin [Planctomycetota bacterium]